MSEPSNRATPGRLFSADSHVIESLKLWEDLIPVTYWTETANAFLGQAGGSDPSLRTEEMETDGVFGEVLYPTFGLALFAIEDPSLQAACCHRYNEWLADYCAVSPARLFGVGMIPTYDMDTALQELEYCKSREMRGAMIWQVPHPDLPFSSDHYDPFWRAAQDHSIPVSLHILTGFNYSKALLTRSLSSGSSPIQAPAAVMPSASAQRVRLKLDSVLDSLGTMIFYGIFERFPELRVVLVENEVGWLPFAGDQWDYYARGQRELYELSESEIKGVTWPSDYLRKNVFVTFFRDPLVGRIVQGWGENSWMWSNDFPHPNSTWPHSRQSVEEMLGGLPPEIVQKLIWGNAAQLYGLKELVAQMSS